jgi:hypothetical protein
MLRVCEPLSNITGGVKGGCRWEPFLVTAIMANSNFQRSVKIEDRTGLNKVIALLITFDKGEKVTSKKVYI